MFKKLSASIFALALVAGVLAPAQAQDTIAIFFDDPVNGLTRYGNTTPGQPFDVVVVSNIDDSSCASEFVVTELTIVAPGVFKLATTKVNNTQLDLGDNSVGEYVLAYGDCVASGPQEVVRLQYGEFGGTVGPDTIMTIRGLQPGDSVPSTFGGEIGYIDPSDVGHIIDPAPWPHFDIIDPTKGPDPHPTGDGVCVINGDAVDNEMDSISSLKARF
jgi:hypothetical protein